MVADRLTAGFLRSTPCLLWSKLPTACRCSSIRACAVVPMSRRLWRWEQPLSDSAAHTSTPSRSVESMVWYPNCGPCSQNSTYSWLSTATPALPISGPQARNASDRLLVEHAPGACSANHLTARGPWIGVRTEMGLCSRRGSVLANLADQEGRPDVSNSVDHRPGGDRDQQCGDRRVQRRRDPQPDR